MDLGTIDIEGFRADLKSIADYDYPRLQLVKLPFNWFVPQTSGIRQHVMNPAPTLSTVQNGSRIVVFVTSNGAGANPAVIGVTDSAGNTYTQKSEFYQAFSGAQIDIFESIVTVAGSLTITPTTSGAGSLLCEAVEVGGVSGAGAFVTANTAYNLGVGPSTQIDICYGGVAAGTPQAWVQNGSGWAALDINLPALANKSAASWTQNGDGVTNPLVSPNITGWPGNPIPIGSATYVLSAGGNAGVPSPITPIVLPGPCNFIALVSEAIDEQGVYQQSALIGQQAAAGFIRLNGQGNVWIPLSFADPLTPGYVTVNDTYKNCPIVGTGFSSLQAPFGQLDFQPALPIFYTGTPPTTISYLLAFVGLNVGVGAGIGIGAGDTYAIPSAAGPVTRMKDECLI